MKRIKIFDTTLRDGEQSPGCSMNLAEKIEMAKQLEKLGVDIIEAGFAIASPMDHKSVQAIAAAVEHCTVASLARCTKGDIDAAWDAVKEAKHPRIHVFLATSDIHMEYKLRMTREQVLQRISDMVAYAKSFCDDIEFSAEDASRSDWAFLAQCYSNAVAAGATTLNVPDTVGYSTPQEMADLITYLKAHVVGVENTDISVHCHNDLGMATALALEGVKNGGDRQQLHEIIRVYSHEAAAKVKLEGKRNDLIDKIAADDRIPLTKEEILSELDPVKYIGRCVSQTEEFVSNVIEPILKKYSTDEVKVELNV